jgi:hypothetical protein
VKDNINLQASDIWESRDLSVDYITNKKIYVLFEGGEDGSVSGEARRAGDSKEYTGHVAALALYSNKAYERIIGGLFLKINKPLVPTEFFDVEKKPLLG